MVIDAHVILRSRVTVILRSPLWIMQWQFAHNGTRSVMGFTL